MEKDLKHIDETSLNLMTEGEATPADNPIEETSQADVHIAQEVVDEALGNEGQTGNEGDTGNEGQTKASSGKKKKKKGGINPVFASLRSATRMVVGSVVGCYLLVILLLNLPAVQTWLATAVSRVLSEVLHTRVELGHVDISLTGQLVLDDLTVWDRQGEEALRASRLSVKMELDELLDNKRIRINYAQLMGTHAHIYQEAEGEPLNIQFIIDTFASKDTTKKTPIDLAIKRVVIRRSEVSYERRWKPQTPGRFNTNHLHLANLNLTAILRQLTPEGIDLGVSRLSADDSSGLSLEQLSFDLLADKEMTRLKNLKVELPNSSLDMPHLTLKYRALPDGGKLREWLSSVDVDGALNLHLTPSDIEPLVPSLTSFRTPLDVDLTLNGTMDNIHVPHVRIEDGARSVALDGSFDLRHVTQGNRRVEGRIRNLHVASTLPATLHDIVAKIPAEIPALKPFGDIDARGNFLVEENHYVADLDVSTRLGDVFVDGDYTPAKAKVHVATGEFNASPIFEALGKEPILGRVALDMTVDGEPRLVDGLPNLKAKGQVKHIELKGYDFRNITTDCSVRGKSFDGLLAIDDPNLKVRFEGTASAANDLYRLNGSLDVSKFDLDATGLLEKPLGRTFVAQLVADIEGRKPEDLVGKVDVSNFSMTDAKGTLSLRDVKLQNSFNGARRHVVLESPYVTGSLDGILAPASLKDNLFAIAHQYVPSYVNSPASNLEHNDIECDLTVLDLNPIEQYIGKNLKIPASTHLRGSVNSALSQVHVEAETPFLSFGDVQLHDVRVTSSGTADSLFTNVAARILASDKTINANVDLSAIDDHILLQLNADNTLQTGLRGEVTLKGVISRNEDNTPTLDTYLLPTTIHINDKVGDIDIMGSHLRYSNKELQVDTLRIQRDSIYVVANGMVNADPENTIKVDLGGISVEKIMELAKVKPVALGGRITGCAEVSQLFTKPIVDIHLDVPEFTFNNGYMGHADIRGSWGRIVDNIFIDALIVDSLMAAETHAVGTIAPYKGNRGGLNLDINCKRSNLHFLNRYTSNIFSSCEGRVSGWVNVGGTFGEVGIEGAVRCDEAEIGLPFLGVNYHLSGDSIFLSREGDITWQNATIYDPKGNSTTRGHKASISGLLHHDHFSDMTFSMALDADNILGYNFNRETSGDLPFFGTVWGTGHVEVNGRPGQVNIDVQATPQKGSSLEYNVSAPSALTSNNFITIGSRDTAFTLKDSIHVAELPVKSDMNIDFSLDMTPDLEMRLLMDANTMDYIRLRGSGPVHAKYYNKGSLMLYGNYTVESGRYQLNLASLAQRRDFVLQRGGTITFTGDPFDSELELKAKYDVPARVALKDLSSASSFSDNKVPVSCLVDVTGKLRSLQLGFDIDLPTATEDEKQLVRSQISTEEERYTQFIYLLAVGRFFTYDYTGTQQQSLTAVNSLISSSLSSQFNQMLSSIIKSNKWAFGANVATGQQGWNDMDVEGQLTGSLFNDRLIINGNVGYRDRAMNTTSNNFVGDFDARYLLTNNGNLSIKAYSETNDRYFTKSSLTTQGIGIMAKKDFSSWKELFTIPRHKRKKADRKAKKATENAENVKDTTIQQ